MLTDKYFNVDVVDKLLILAPLKNIGSLAAENFQPELRDALRLLGEQELDHVVVDFSQIDYFGSSMIEALLQLWRHAQNEEGKLALCGLSKVGKEVLSIGKFDTLWPIYATREEAIGAVSS